MLIFALLMSLAGFSSLHFTLAHVLITSFVMTLLLVGICTLLSTSFFIMMSFVFIALLSYQASYTGAIFVRERHNKTGVGSSSTGR